jgi:hypothetical protein
LRRKLATHFFCVNNFAHFFSAHRGARSLDVARALFAARAARMRRSAKSAENKAINRDGSFARARDAAAERRVGA